jgi:glutaredoxin
MKTIYVFTTIGCAHCKELKKKLIDESIPFCDIEITKNEELWKNMISQTGYDILPTIYIRTDNDDSGIAYIPDKDFKNINEIIEIIKKNI